jgi:hypothetical protein
MLIRASGLLPPPPTSSDPGPPGARLAGTPGGLGSNLNDGRQQAPDRCRETDQKDGERVGIAASDYCRISAELSAYSDCDPPNREGRASDPQGR